MTNYDVVFKDDFTGTDGAPPHRGKWVKGIARHGAAVIANPTVAIDMNTLKLAITETGAAAYATIFAMTRAEFKPPFKFKYLAKAHDDELHCAFDTSDIRDGYITDTYFYGKELGQWKIVPGDDFILELVHDGVTDSYNSGAVHSVADTWYIVSGEVTESGKYYHLDLTITLTDGTPVWSEDGDFDRPAVESFRFRHHEYVQNGTGTGYIDAFTVWGIPTKKADVRVTLSDLAGGDYVITNDVLSFRISYREKSYPSAEVVINNPGNKYSAVTLKHEVEICAGTEYVKWLLYRGYVETPDRSWPPALLTIESSKGYAKRLDYRETDAETWASTASGSIVKDIVSTYFSGIFTTDHVSTGTAIDVESDDEPCGDLIKKLADTEGFILDVDMNRDIHFCLPATERSSSNLELAGDDIIQIHNKTIDEIVNSLTVVGSGSTPPTHQYTDAASQAAYWLREKTITDDDLTSSAAVTAKAHSLGAKLKDPVSEIPISLGGVFCISLYDDLTVTCTDVGLSGETGNVRGLTFRYGPGGLRTDINLSTKPFLLSDAMATYETNITKVSNTIVYSGGGGADLSGYIPKGDKVDKGSGTTTAVYAVIASRTPTSGKTYIVAKVVVTCQYDSYIQYFWNGAAVSEERLVNVGMIEHFNYGTYSMVGDGAKAFQVKAKYYSQAGTVYVEVNGEEV